MSEVGNLSREYLEAHMLSIHDYESWGKAIVEAILADSLSQAGAVKEIRVDAPFTVSATPQGCVKICYKNFCIHAS